MNPYEIGLAENREEDQAEKQIFLEEADRKVTFFYLFFYALLQM